MYIERNNSIFQKHAQSFLPTHLNSKLILQCLSSSEERALMLKKSQQLENEMKANIIKVQKLRVTGREFYKTFAASKQHFKSNSTRIKNIRVFVDTPEKLVKNITHSIESRNYRGEIEALEKISVKTPQEILANINKKDKSTQQSKSLHKQQLKHSLEDEKLNEEDDIYEKMILQNPTVYKKIMMAYNASKRQFDKTKYKFVGKKVQSQQENGQYLQRNLSKKRLFSKKDSLSNQYREFQMAVNLSNNLVVIPPLQVAYKAYICRGNNGLLVKSLLKSRPWWSFKSKDDIQSCNLVWTEWKRNKSINKLPKQPSFQFQQAISDQLSKDILKPKIPHLKLKEKDFEHQLLKKLTRDEKNPLLENFFQFKTKNSNLLSTNAITQQKFEEQVSKLFTHHTHRLVQKQHKIVNHIPGCLSLHSKKDLFYNLKAYYQKQNIDLFSVIPLTFHIKKGSQDPQFIRFSEYFNEASRQLKGKLKWHNVWICKPGQNSNRGNGITVLNNLQEIGSLANQKCKDHRTLIIQKYFQNPFLYNKRKFDIRCYILITTVNGIIKGYWYQQGYLRTSSKEFTLKNLQNKYVHLTNDAIQKKSEEYGKFQSFNKVSYSQFQKYLQTNHSQQKLNFGDTLLKMKKIATDLINSAAHKLNHNHRQYCFQLFGLDYMLDQKLTPFLIQANSNPCISVDGTVLTKIIPSLLQNVIRIAIDPVFPPPFNLKNKGCQYKAQNLFESNKFVLVYDSFYDKTQAHFEEHQEEIQHFTIDQLQEN